MTKDQRTAWLTSIGIFLFVLLMIWLAISPLRSFFSSPTLLREAVHEFGWLAPVVIILIHAAQVIAAPIPGQPIDLANGYLFGWWLGSIISLAGLLLGSIITIGLTKHFGRPLVERFITPKGLQKIRAYIHTRNQYLFFFLFLLPATPDDLLCFAIGLTSIPFRRAVLISILGRAPGVIAVVIAGATGQSLNPITFSIAAVLVSILLMVIVWTTPLGKAMQLPQTKGGAEKTAYK